jgi:glutamate racemase
MKKLRGYKCEFVKPHDSVVTGDDKKIYVRDNIMKRLLSYSHTSVRSIIIACHSISSCILDILIENNFMINKIPIYEPIVPMCLYIQNTYKNKNILVLSTPLTQRMRWHYRLLKSDRLVIKYLTFPTLAKELELGWNYNKSLDRLKRQKEFIKKCDCVVLGCTHYNTIKDVISQELRIKYNFKGVVLDSNEILANFFVT